MAQTVEWKCATVSKSGLIVPSCRSAVVEHPLRNPVVHEGALSKRKHSNAAASSINSFNINTVLEGIDPLTKFSVENEEMQEESMNSNFNSNSNSLINQEESRMEAWNSRKQAILNKYTTSEKLSIITSFLSDGDKVVVKAQSTAVNKVQHRLEQLDYFEESSQRKFDLSQAEYVGRIEQLNKELVTAWNSEQRVKSLKIAIQCAKLLSDTDVLCFYPSKFVLITDILDIFGKLVYERLKNKSNSLKQSGGTKSAASSQINADHVSESVKETCRNWFYKIASIRELVPRIYVEMAILKSYSFLTKSEHSDALLRLSRMIRGIGNPLVAIYARCYLCRVGLSIKQMENEYRSNNYLLQNFHDFLSSYNHLFKPTIQQDVVNQNMDISSYLTLYTPALDYILQAVACNASPNLLEELLDYCQNHGNSPLLLNTIMAAFKPNFIASRAQQLLDMIQECSDEKNFPSHLLLRTLGLCVSISSHNTFSGHENILNKAWRQITNIRNAENYISCIEAWMKFTVKNFPSSVINAVIGDIIQHLTPEKRYENHYSELKNIMNIIVSDMQDFEVLLSMDNFLPLIDLFHQDLLKVEVCKNVLINCSSDQQTSDPVTINALVFLCSVLHDSVNALTVDDEKRQISELLCSVVRRVNYGKDFEKQLSFYVEARGAFTNLDLVLVQLVQCVNTLAANTRKIVKGYHTRKTQAFVHACAAYCFITIPSIISIKSRMELYLLSGRVALFNNCLEQADACFLAALSTLSEFDISSQQQNESYFLSYINSFLSVILIVPDNPNNGVLDLLRSLLNTVKSLNRQFILIKIYLNVLDILYALSQDNYLYHINLVESNDTLYGSDPKYLRELDRIGSVILEEILTAIKTLSFSSSYSSSSSLLTAREGLKKQSELSLELLVRIFTRGDVKNSQTLQNLAKILWTRISKREREENIQQQDKKYIARTKKYLSKLFEETTMMDV